MKSELPEIGKISPEIFNELIFPRLGAKSKNILVGPQHGVDVGIIEIGGQAVALTADPVFIVPEYGWERAAWFAIHILASDAATSGLPPRYLAIDLNLPLGMTKPALETVWETIHRECRKMGIAVITGHTARYDNCHFPMVGGAVVMSVGGKDEYVTPKFARAGDQIIITKGPAIEATGLLALLYKEDLRRACGDAIVEAALARCREITVVRDALIATEAGPVTAMHDATEGGVLGGLWEIAEASGAGMEIDASRMVWPEDVDALCRLLAIDPLAAIAEGTLLITVTPEAAPDVIAALEDARIPCSEIGRVTDDPSRRVIVRRDGRTEHIAVPHEDPFWPKFFAGVEKLSGKGSGP